MTKKGTKWNTQPAWKKGTLKFGGKGYMFTDSFKLKSEADKTCKRMRSRGYSARVVKGSGWSTKHQRRVTLYSVYSRKRK